MGIKSGRCIIFVYVFLCSTLLFKIGWGIECYVCKSDDETNCTTSKSSPGPIVTAANCSNPHKLLNDWITNHDFMKYTIGDVSLEKVVNFIDGEVSNTADLKDVTTCAYFIASSENPLTYEIDKDVAEVRNFFGDEHAGDPLTIYEFVLRDCVTVKIRPETKEATTNRCFPFPVTKNLAKLHFCTCTTDRCNLPDDKVEGFIREEEKEANNQSSQKYIINLTLFHLLTIMITVGSV